MKASEKRNGNWRKNGKKATFLPLSSPPLNSALLKAFSKQLIIGLVLKINLK